MNLILSRHAKRRMKLYSIEESDIQFLLNTYAINSKVGRQDIVAKLEKFSYPIKVIFEVKENTIQLITCYLLKRAKDENRL